MRRRSRAWLAALVICSPGSCAVWPDGAAAQDGPRPGLQRLTLHTVPRVAGVRVRVRGVVHRTDARGRVTLDVRTFHQVRRTHKGRLAFAPPEVLPTRVAGGVETRFDRFYDRGRIIALSLYVTAGAEFIDLQGGTVPVSRVGVVTLKSRLGVRVRFKSGESVRLHASRAVTFRDGVRSKPIEYAVESVTVDGANVVNRAQQRFFPLRARHLTIPLLLYSARFSARDAIFGFPLGSAVELVYPSGRVVRVPLHGGDGRAIALPRGEYRVRVAGSGFSFERPLALSRDQTVALEVVSYLDVAAVLGGTLALAVGLVLVRRPLVRRRLRRLLALRMP
jgi:hypothetical protein